MHSTLTARSHEQMTARWKSALDKAVMMHASWGPDVWYILADDFMANMCPVACGGDNGKISNECWGKYKNPDKYFAYTRHLIANADSIEALSWAFGYGSHAVEDWRGHMEYIIPDWVNPEGQFFSRHTLIDATGGALAFNVDGLYGYPSDFTYDKTGIGYKDGGFFTSENAESYSGTRDPSYGMSVVIEGEGKDRKIKWTGVLGKESMNLSTDSLRQMFDNASLGSASEGILAHQHGKTDYDALGNSYPIITEDGSVTIDCSTDYNQRMESEEGYGYPMPCQTYIGSLTGLGIWFSYLKPAEDGSDNIVLDRDNVALWLDRIANKYESGGNRLDDKAVFEINEETGLSEAHLYGIDDRDFTYGKTMPEILNEVLSLSVNDVVERLYENGHIVGTALQSKTNPVDKAQFVDFDFHYRPRFSAWPAQLNYHDESINLSPAAPGPFSKMQLSFDVSPKDINTGKELVFPYYLVTIDFDKSKMYGTGTLKFSLSYKNENDISLENKISTEINLDTMQVDDNAKDFIKITPLENDLYQIRIMMDNYDGGYYYHYKNGERAAIVLETELLASNPAQPPYDLLLDFLVQPYCEVPDLENPSEPAKDNSACPLYAPDFPEPEIDGDEETEIETMESAEGDGDLEPEDDNETDLDNDTLENEIETETTPDGDSKAEEENKGSSSCFSSGNSSGLLFVLMLSLLFISRKKNC